MTDIVNIMTDLDGAEPDAALQVQAALAARISARRKALKLSFDGLAARCGVSKGLLVQVEQGKANPSIATLCRIAAGLNVSVAELVEVAQAPDAPIRILVEDEAKALWTGPAGGSARLLVGSDGPEMLEQWMWELHPGERFESDVHPAGTQELVHVLQGELAFEIDGKAHSIPTGASAHARTDRTHAYACAGREPVRFVMTVWEPGAPSPR